MLNLLKRHTCILTMAICCVGLALFVINCLPNNQEKDDKQQQITVAPRPTKQDSTVTKQSEPPPASSNPITNLQEQFKVAKQSDLPAVDLRGYGRVSGRFLDYGTDLSVLEISCADAAKAAVVQAKYSSDLRCLGGVSDKQVTLSGKALTINDVTDQGATVSLRQGNKVFILSASSVKVLEKALKASGAAAISSVQFESKATVPMYLDSWDQHAFRFYYRPWEMPKDEKLKKNYDIVTEFDYAKKQGDLGFVFWATENLMDSAEGMNNDVWWDWGARAATKRKLPIVVNTMSSASTWLLNDYREETYQKMPQYCGSYHSVAEPYHGATGHLSWCADKAKDIELSLLKKIVSKYAKQDNVLDFLEPHGELQHGAYDVFLEYGPVADKSYRKFLKQKYHDLAKVSERWTGDPNMIQSWDEIRVPELASFAGWGKRALDLSGTWRIQYETPADKDQKFDKSGRGLTHKTVESKPAPAEWFKVRFNDKSWPTVTAPGHDRTMFLPKRPAVYRKTFSVDQNWLRKQKRVWLYIWDLNYGKHRVDVVYAYLNGKKAGEDKLQHATPHWCAFEVTKLLKAGSNQLSIRLPKGFLAYRVYLSNHAPKQYPDLGEKINARWVDFTDWRGWTRLEMARRGIEMIRQVDPNRGIVCMAPDGYFAGIKELCEDYGARFHNTGHMGGVWNEFLPMLMRSSRLPFSLEPGGPAADERGFKRMMGHYLTEGINAIHYFIHIGSIIWEPKIKAHFEKILPMLKDLGRIHIPQAEAALLMNERVNKLTGYPWGKAPNTNLPSGYWCWAISKMLLESYTLDGVSEKDFARGNADHYKVIVDLNSSIMEESQVDEISNWVKNGGVFVTFIQTGRHTPEKKDSWPISRLTGYKVTDITKYDIEDNPLEKWRLKFAPDQQLFDEQELTIQNHQANGLKLQKVAPECKNLILWEDDSVAAGLRPYGKGYVIALGVKFCNGRIWHGGTNKTIPMFQEILKWAKVKPTPAYSDDVTTRSFVSNNGLYNAWTMWNSEDKSKSTDLIFRDGMKPDYCLDVVTRKKLKPTEDQGHAVLTGLDFPAQDSKMFLAPRKQLLVASLKWFELQRNWWRGTRKPTKVLPEYEPKNALPLTENWKFKPVDPKEILDVAKYAAVDFDDSKWGTRRLGVWIVPEELDSRHVVFRQKFKVPNRWSAGKTYLWIRSWFSNTLTGSMRVWLDGREIKPLSPPRNGIDGMQLDLKPGTEHLLAVEIEGTKEGSLVGPKGNTFISYIPDPVAKEDLIGKWQPSKDALVYDSPIELPGGKWDTMMARRKITIPEKYKDKQVYLHMDTSNGILGAIINGHWLRRHHHALGSITHLNITPWIKFGKDNEFEIEIVNWFGSGRGEIKELSLYFYDNK